MPTAVKRRKVSGTTFRNAPYLTINHQGIQPFTKVSKSRSIAKVDTGKSNGVDIILVTQLEQYSTTLKKRKLHTVEDVQESTVEAALSALSTPTNDKIKLSQKQLKLSRIYPHTLPKPFVISESSLLETVTGEAPSLFDSILLSSNSLKTSPLSFDAPTTIILNPKTQHKHSEFEGLPKELLDLINLHAAFLTALSIHYAHNGTDCPADLRVFCPDVSRAWGKRSVTVKDIRRTLGVLNSKTWKRNEFDDLVKLGLSDYGHGKICIEIQAESETEGNLNQSVNEDNLNQEYRSKLAIFWKERKAIDMKPVDFMRTLPLEPIRICPSLSKMSPLFAKGQQRLEDLRACTAIQRSDNTNETKEEGGFTESSSGAGPKPSLLERLRAKQSHRASLPPPPSKAELDRKAGLQRIESVFAVLTILSTSGSVGQHRVSFTFPTVLGKLQDSFKTLISKEEGCTCLRLLATEIAPDWIKIVKIGKVDAIVVNRDGRPGELDFKERVKRAS